MLLSIISLCGVVVGNRQRVVVDLSCDTAVPPIDRQEGGNVTCTAGWQQNDVNQITQPSTPPPLRPRRPSHLSHHRSELLRMEQARVERIQADASRLAQLRKLGFGLHLEVP